MCTDERGPCAQIADSQRAQAEVMMHRAEKEAVIEDRVKLQRQMLALQGDKETLQEQLIALQGRAQ